MKVIRHGLSIGINRIDDDFFLSIKVAGKLTHEDYKIITPMIDAALEGVDEPTINAFVDATQLEGWELRAAWDDLKLGLKHNKEFKKIAILGHKKWQEYLPKIASWFISGEMKHFEDKGEAFSWLKE
ncbi:MAG: STAS/SEC14 domain-containing protein [Gammaproteobacteria bacterium]|nr:STAS/SEC14 domain-containing protein [Gammaproteobacteria bacterium]